MVFFSPKSKLNIQMEKNIKEKLTLIVSRSMEKES